MLKRLALAAVFALFQLTATHAQQLTERDRYVAERDPSYSFLLVRSAPGIGYTVHVLELTSRTWRSAAAQLPMTKAGVRAMDAITAFCRSAEGGSVAVEKFVVAGGSKRGLDTWLSAAVDKRVVAIVPLVVDLL